MKPKKSHISQKDNLSLIPKPAGNDYDDRQILYAAAGAFFSRLTDEERQHLMSQYTLTSRPAIEMSPQEAILKELAETLQMVRDEQRDGEQINKAKKLFHKAIQLQVPANRLNSILNQTIVSSRLTKIEDTQWVNGSYERTQEIKTIPSKTFREFYDIPIQHEDLDSETYFESLVSLKLETTILNPDHCRRYFFKKDKLTDEEIQKYHPLIMTMGCFQYHEDTQTYQYETNEQIFIEYNADTGSDKKRKIPTHSIIEIFNNELNHTYRVSTGRWVGNHEIFESIADPTPMYNRAIQLEFDEAQDQEKYQFEHRALKEKATLMAEKMKEIHTLRKSTITKPWSSVSEEKLEVGDLIYLHRESLDQIPKLEAALGLSNANDNTPSERNANRYAAIWHLYLEYKDACKTLEDFVKHHNAAAKEKIQIARAKQLSPEKNTAIFQMAHLDLIAACFALYKENLPAIPKKQALALEEMANQLQDYARFREEVTRCFYDKPTHREKINVFWQNMNATMAGAKITLDIHPLLQKIIEKSHQENQIKIADIATLDVDAMNLSKENKKIFFDLIIKIPQLYTQLMERTQDKTSNPEEMYVSLWILYDAYQESCAKLQGMVNNFYFYESARSKLNQLAQWLRKNYPESKPTTLPAYTAAQGSGGEVLQSLGHEVADKLRAYDPSTQSMETLQELLNYISHLQEMTKNLTVTPDWVEEWHNIIDDGSPPREHILSFS